MNDVVNTLKERGFVQQCSNEEGLRESLEAGALTFYAGYDPTGSSLQVGHLVPLMLMAHLQHAGHKPIALIGGGTSRIGDPSGKTETRKILSIERIRENSEKFRKQISRFLDFSEGGAVMIDNAEWLTELNYIDFLRDIGRHFSVNRMLSFEAYKQRLEKGLSFIEFNYQLLQSFDYLTLYRRSGCTLQVGGDDQWGNIVAGMELVRRIEGREVFALTCPLIARADGKKMGKTEKGALYLDADLVAPYDFYQYWINVPDPDVRKFLLLFTFLPVEEIDELAALKGKELNRAKERLAFELTTIVHGKESAKDVRRTSRAAFGTGSREGLESMPSFPIGLAELKAGVGVIELFARSGLCSSNSEARRLIAQGGAYVNDCSVESPEETIGADRVIDGAIILRAGKKRYYKAVVSGG